MREHIEGDSRRWWRDGFLALVLGVSAALAVMVTLREVGLGFDEPANIRYATRMRTWLGLFFRSGDGVGPGQALEPTLFGKYWFYETPRHRHPPLTGYLLNLSWWVAHKWLEEPWCYRLASAALFGVVVGLLYLEGRRWSRPAGLAAAAAFFLMPRIFGHAHMAATDTPSMAFWFLCWVCLRRLGRRGGQRRAKETISSLPAVALGLVLGTSLLVRFTNWTVVVPIAVWWFRFGRRRGLEWKRMGVVVVVALSSALLLNPAWWRNPIASIYLFLEQSLGRARFQPIPTYFLGRTYRMALPWYNGPVLTAATLPIATLVLFALGAAAVVREGFRDGAGLFALTTVGWFWVMRALPITPGHDGVRLFLPMFPFVALLAGRGAEAIRGFVRARGAGGVVLLLLISSAGYQLVRHHPHYLSYYGEAVGGPAGAQRLGFETTYWWDAADERFLDMLNRDLPPNAHIYTIPPAPTLRYWQRRGRLRKDIHIVEDEANFGRIEFLVLLCRQGWFDPAYTGGRHRPSAYQAWTLWHWYRTWRRQWRVHAPWHGVPLILVVRHRRGKAVLR